jgi:polyphosphate kinase
MENTFSYFKRDISWLSFNYRVLMEAANKSLPIYERIKFLSIYSSNLEEFYEIRVANHRGVIMKKHYAEESVSEAEDNLTAITEEVSRQQKTYYRIFTEEILPELSRHNIIFYQQSCPLPFHEDFVRTVFNEEIFPFLSPMMIQPGLVRTFIRDRRIYLIVRMKRRGEIRIIPDQVSQWYYAMMLIPETRFKRFVELPEHEGKKYIMFIEDVIRANLPSIFPGYQVDSCYSMRISRDADIYIADESGDLVEKIRKKVNKRKIGALSRCVYDRAMPDDFLQFICEAFNIQSDDLVASGRYLNLKDLASLPNPFGNELVQKIPEPLHIPQLDGTGSIFKAVRKHDVLLAFPYQSFDYLVRFLMEAATDPKVGEIKITQYRVAENSTVINALMNAAKNGKKVTVFVELKARFDEENNMSTAKKMEECGVRILYSLPGLKVHAKVAVVTGRECDADALEHSFACLSTGNFNETTATIYSDMALLTSDASIVSDVCQLFDLLEGKVTTPVFNNILVSQFNMVPQLTTMIRRECEHVKAGRTGHIVLKMNGLHDQNMIDELYKASECGVKIDLLVRGICCLIPNQPYSANIRVVRIVDMFLEHARLWYFWNDGEEEVFLASADWMRRNLNRRIESACPIRDKDIRQKIIDILKIQLQDNVKACLIDENLNNNFIRNDKPPVRAQMAIYNYFKDGPDRRILQSEG